MTVLIRHHDTETDTVLEFLISDIDGVACAECLRLIWSPWDAIPEAVNCQEHNDKE